MLHSLMSMWWELHCLQEWNQRHIFGLLWHMFTCYWDPSLIVSNFLKDWTNRGRHLLKKYKLKKWGAPREQVQTGLRQEMCPFATIAQEAGFVPSTAEELWLKTSRAGHQVLHNWSRSYVLSDISFPNNRVLLLTHCTLGPTSYLKCF